MNTAKLESSHSAAGGGAAVRRVKNPALRTIREGWEGNAVAGGRFLREGSGAAPSSVWQALKWRLGRNPQAAEKRRDTFCPEVVSLRDFDRDGRDSIAWLGHSSFLISLGGVRLLTDPCLRSLPGVRRRVGLPCPVGELTGISHVLVSHDHRDHLDRPTLRRIMAANPGADVLAPLGAGHLLPGYSMQEAAWWQEYRATAADGGLRVSFLPARHWGRRGLTDLNRVLWGSFLLTDGRRKVFFAGDTAYDPRLFRDIRSQAGDIDICLLPIGAYAPRWFMSPSHMDPEEAFRAFLDLGGRVLVPMHYGTYDLSDEPPGEPLRLLRRAAACAGREDCIAALPVGGLLAI